MMPGGPSEEEKNGCSGSGQASDGAELSINLSTLSWPDVFSRHESMLRNHSDLCRMIKDHVVPDSDASRALKRMMDATQQLVREAGDLRKEFASHGTASRILTGREINRVDEQRASAANGHGSQEGDLAGRSADSAARNGHVPAAAAAGQNEEVGSAPPFVFDTQPTPVSMPRRPKKRAREDGAPNAGAVGSAAVSRGGKKAKMENDTLKVGATNGAQSEPEGEDISDEVERRLELREERRQKRKDPQQKKRKRDSSASPTKPAPTDTALAKRRRVKDNDSDKPNAGNTSSKPGKQKKRNQSETGDASQGGKSTKRRKKTKKSKKR